MDVIVRLAKYKKRKKKLKRIIETKKKEYNSWRAG